MHIQTDRALVPAGTPALRYLHVTVVAPPAPPRTTGPRPAADVALVLDRSGSMDGGKIRMARQAVAHALTLLTPRDHFALVVYDDAVDVVQPRTAATREAVTVALRRLEAVDARGSTNLAEGWTRGAEELRRAMTASPGNDTTATTTGAIRRVLLLTDGLANEGVTEPDTLAEMARQLRDEGIGTSTFGVGADFDETLLVRLAQQGGGHFYYIETPAQLPDLFASELGEALDVVARDVVFEIAAPEGVTVVPMHELSAAPMGGGLRVRLGDLVANQELRLLLGVKIERLLAVGDVVEVHCRLHDRGGVFVTQPLGVPWRAVSAADDAAQPVNVQMLRDVAEAVASQARLRALAANRRGEFAKAKRLLQQAIDVLRTLAPADATVARLIAALVVEREEMARDMDPRARKVLYQRSYAISESRMPDGKARRRKVS